MAINTEMYIEIGKILMAHQKAIDARYHKNLFIRETGHNIKLAKKRANEAPHYEFEELYKEYKEAQVVEPSVQVMKYVCDRFSKHFTLLKHQFIAKYPEHKALLEFELAKNEKEIQRYISKKENSSEQRAKFRKIAVPNT